MPTAATIFWAAAADETSKATIRFCLGSYILGKCRGFGASRLVLQSCHQLRRSSLRPVLYNVQAHSLQAFGFEVEHTRGVVGQVNDASRDDRPPVIDTHHHRPPVAQVSD